MGRWPGPGGGSRRRPAPPASPSCSPRAAGGHVPAGDLAAAAPALVPVGLGGLIAAGQPGRSIFGKLRVPDSGDAHRRVLAVLAHLTDRPPAVPGGPGL